MFFVTTVMALYAWHHLGWQLLTEFNHFYFAFPTFLFLSIIVMFGCTTKYNSLSGKWNTKRSLRNKRIHKCLGYSFIILGQGAIFTGIYHYRHVDAHRYDTPYEWIQLGIFLGILIILEAIYQRSLAREVPLNGCNNLGLISI